MFSGSIDLSPCAASGSASAAGRVSTPLFPDLKEIKAEQIGRVVVFTLYRPKVRHAMHADFGGGIDT